MIYIGGYPAQDNQGIYLLENDLSLKKQICNDEGTSYFDVVDEKIYTIIKREDKGGIAIFEDGQEVKCVLTPYKPACFIKRHLDKIYATYYHDSCVQIYDLNLNLLHEIHYPTNSKCHQVSFFKNNWCVLCLGLDQIIFYNMENEEIKRMDFPQNSGPRHLVKTSDEKTMFVISELSNELFVVDMNEMKIKQVLSIKQNDEPTTGAAIRLSKDEKHIYTSTRGQDLIKHFIKKDQWEEVQCFQLNGNLPRDFDVNYECVVVGYQGSNLVEKIYLDEEKNLTNHIEQVYYDKIVCVRIYD